MNAHPVRVTVDDDLRRSRLTVFFRLLLAIPHIVWLALWTVAALAAAVVNWFAVLFTGRAPRPLHRFLAAFIRYSAHVSAFIGLAANPFPGFVGDNSRYPVRVEVAESARQRRLVTLFKLILVLPALIIAGLLGGQALQWGGLAGVATFLAWFAALVKGRMPTGLRDLVVWGVGYSAQVGAYLLSLTDRYPTSNPNWHVSGPAPERSVRLELEDDRRRERVTVFFRNLLAIPHLIWLSLWGIAVSIAMVVGWVAALVLGRLPEPLHRFSAAYVSCSAQVYAYLLLVTQPFPGFVGGRYPLTIAIDPPTRQHRLVTFFRLLLALPALLIAGALAYLLFVIWLLAWVPALVTGRMPLGFRNSAAAAIRYWAQTNAYLLLLTPQYPHSSPAVAAQPEPEAEAGAEPYTTTPPPPAPEPEAAA